MTQPADFTDFLAEIFQGGAWGFDQSETIGRVFEEGDFAMAQDELADLELLGEFIQEQATAKGIDLMQFSLVKDSVARSDDNVLTPELLGSIAYGIHLSQNIDTYITDDGEYVMGADGQPLLGAAGATEITFSGGENENAARRVTEAIIDDNNRNTQDNNNPAHKDNMNVARLTVGLGM